MSYELLVAIVIILSAVVVFQYIGNLDLRERLHEELERCRELERQSAKMLTSTLRGTAASHRLELWTADGWQTLAKMHYDSDEAACAYCARRVNAADTYRLLAYAPDTSVRVIATWGNSVLL